MLDLSGIIAKLMVFCGCLAMAGMALGMWPNLLPGWFVLAIAFIPFAAIAFLQVDDVSPRTERLARLSASAWYVLAAFSLLVALVFADFRPTRWPACIIAMLVGAGPCVVMIHRAIGRRRRSASDAEERDGSMQNSKTQIPNPK